MYSLALIALTYVYCCFRVCVGWSLRVTACNSLVNTLAAREKYTLLHVAGTGNHVKLAEVITLYEQHTLQLSLCINTTHRLLHAVVIQHTVVLRAYTAVL
jgi:hypothetical protein